MMWPAAGSGSQRQAGAFRARRMRRQCFGYSAAVDRTAPLSFLTGSFQSGRMKWQV
jgi:hypothetical protein